MSEYNNLSKGEQLKVLMFIEEQGYESEMLYEHQVEDLYAEFLDECFGNVEVAGCTYSTSDLLKSTDPTAFRCGCSDWSSEEFQELRTGDTWQYIRTERLDEIVQEYIDSKEDES